MLMKGLAILFRPWHLIYYLPYFGRGTRVKSEEISSEFCEPAEGEDLMTIANYEALVGNENPGENHKIGSRTQLCDPHSRILMTHGLVRTFTSEFTSYTSPAGIQNEICRSAKPPLQQQNLDATKELYIKNHACLPRHDKILVEKSVPDLAIWKNQNPVEIDILSYEQVYSTHDTVHVTQ